MRIRTKITFMGIFLPLVPVLVVLILVATEKQGLSTRMSSVIDTQTKNELGVIAGNVFAFCKTQNDSMLTSLDRYITVAQSVLDGAGALELSTPPVSWDARNQATGETHGVVLPRLVFGRTWPGTYSDPAAHVPLVDEIVNLVGVTCTIFQKMNDEGDMLRVATTVIGKDGKRAIGTYIPAANADGSPNLVIAAVLRGNEYRGRAFVVDTWNIAVYRPLKDRKGTIVGMIYVGVKQDEVVSFRQSIQNMRIGASGYVFVLGGSGAMRGTYMISKDGARDGENIWDQKDSKGRFFIQELTAAALETHDGEVRFVTYPWKNPGDAAPRLKIAAVTYYAPWDWVIGATAYIDEANATKDNVDGALTQLLLVALLVGIVCSVAASVLAILIGGGITRSITRMLNAAQRMAAGDLRPTELGRTSDEMGDLALAFHQMSGKLSAMMSQVLESSGRVASASGEISQRAQKLAEGAQSQASTLEQTSASMEELTASVDQVSGHAHAQAEAAQQGTGTMTGINASIEEVSKSLADIAGLAGQSLRKAEEGAASVQNVVEGIGAISESSERIGGIVTVISDISDQTNLLALNASIEAARAGEHGRGFAVVAEEVSKLADRSSSSTKEIENLIRDSVRNVGRGVETAQGSREAMDQIRSASLKVKEMIAGLTASMAKQVAAVQRVLGIPRELQRPEPEHLGGGRGAVDERAAGLEGRRVGQRADAVGGRFGGRALRRDAPAFQHGP